jgi:hypothetical protein
MGHALRRPLASTIPSAAATKVRLVPTATASHWGRRAVAAGPLVQLTSDHQIPGWTANTHVIHTNTTWAPPAASTTLNPLGEAWAHGHW